MQAITLANYVKRKSKFVFVLLTTRANVPRNFFVILHYISQSGESVVLFRKEL